MKTLIIFLIIFNTTFSYAQIYENWVIRYNGPLNALDEASAMKSDQSGNVFVTGYSTNINGDLDYVTQKYNACGHLKWRIYINRIEVSSSDPDSPFGIEFAETKSMVLLK